MRPLLTLILTLSIASPALAQDGRVQCYVPSDQISTPGQRSNYLDMGLTQKYRIQQSYQTQEAMNALAGMWYGEVMSPMGNAVARSWYSYEANGLFQYQSQVCDFIGTPCSQNYGTGQWTATQLQDGSYAVMYNWSDLANESACAGFTGILQGSTIHTSDGGVLQRVQ